MRKSNTNIKMKQKKKQKMGRTKTQASSLQKNSIPKRKGGFQGMRMRASIQNKQSFQEFKEIYKSKVSSKFATSGSHISIPNILRQNSFQIQMPKKQELSMDQLLFSTYLQVRKRQEPKKQINQSLKFNRVTDAISTCPNKRVYKYTHVLFTLRDTIEGKMLLLNLPFSLDLKDKLQVSRSHSQAYAQQLDLFTLRNQRLCRQSGTSPKKFCNDESATMSQHITLASKLQHRLTVEYVPDSASQLLKRQATLLPKKEFIETQKYFMSNQRIIEVCKAIRPSCYTSSSHPKIDPLDMPVVKSQKWGGSLIDNFLCWRMSKTIRPKAIIRLFQRVFFQEEGVIPLRIEFPQTLSHEFLFIELILVNRVESFDKGTCNEEFIHYRQIDLDKKANNVQKKKEGCQIEVELNISDVMRDLVTFENDQICNSYFLEVYCSYGEFGFSEKLLRVPLIFSDRIEQGTFSLSCRQRALYWKRVNKAIKGIENAVKLPFAHLRLTDYKGDFEFDSGDGI